MQVSAKGGENPVFRPSGRELYFRRGSQLISAAWKERLGWFYIQSERVVANVSWPKITVDRPFSVAKDGPVVALVSAEDPRPPRVTVVLGWAQGLSKP